MVAADKDMRPECARAFGTLEAEVEALQAQDARQDIAGLRDLLTEHLIRIEGEISALQVKATAWGAVGGVASVAVAAGLAVVAVALR